MSSPQAPGTKVQERAVAAPVTGRPPRPASLGGLVYTAPWRRIPGPSTGKRSKPRGVRAFAFGDSNPACGSANLRGTPPRLSHVLLKPCQARFLSYVSRATRAPRSIVLGDDLAVSLGAQVAQGQQADLRADELDRAVSEGQVGPARVLA